MYQADQIILGANDDGTPTGEYFKRVVGHTGKGKRHFAISVLITNSKGEVLIQERKHKIFDRIWDTTASTHQLHREDGTNETDEEASDRSLEVEYGIPKGSIKYKKYGGINYFAQYGDFCENEHDIFLTGVYDGIIKLNPEEGYSYRWMNKGEFLTDVKTNPKNYTPWTVIGVKLLEERGFFN